MKTSAVLLLASAAIAQGVPYNQAVVGNFGNVAPAQGLFLVDRGGVATVITGLVAAGSVGSGVNAVRMDPIDDRIWLGGINSNGNTATQVNWCRIGAGNTVTQFQQHGTVGGTGSVAALAFDDNGNPIAASGTTTGGGGVFRIDRKLGGAGTLLASLPTGTHNAICRDPAGNLYVGMFTAATVHVLLKNANGTYQAPLLLGTLPITSISGITWSPDPVPAGTNHELLVCTFGVVNNMVFRMPATGGTPTPITTAVQSANWVEYDLRNDDYLFCSGGGGIDAVSTMSRAGVGVQLATLNGGSSGTPSFLDANDDRDADIRAVPMILNGTANPFDLEISVTAPPGELAFLGITAPFGALFGFGVAPANGRVSFLIPNVQSPGLPPGVFTFRAASIDTTTNALTIGAPLLWPAN